MVSICNYDSFITNESIQFAIELFAKNNLTSFFNETYKNDNNQFFISKYFVGLNARNISLTDEFRQSLGLSMSTMLLGCSFNNILCSASGLILYLLITVILQVLRYN